MRWIFLDGVVRATTENLTLRVRMTRGGGERNKQPQGQPTLLMKPKGWATRRNAGILRCAQNDRQEEEQMRGSLHCGLRPSVEMTLRSWAE
jgi:hypothetical protein